MKSLNEITRLAQIGRFRNLAKKALEAYGLQNSHAKFLTIAGNVLFRVYEMKPKPFDKKDSPFIPGQYLLRIHDSNEQKTDAIKLEMEWLRAIRRDMGLPVPEPVEALDGNLMVRVSAPGITDKRDCTVLRWLRGMRITRRIRPHHYRAQGRIMAQLHNHAEKWSPSSDHAKRRFDYDGLFADDVGAGIPNSRAWQLLSDRHRRPFEMVARKTGKIMDEWGEESDVFGLIHGDCGVDANVLFWRGEAHIIDFDDSGYGYYPYDLAIALEHCWEEPANPEYRDALLNGYAEFRTLSGAHIQHMDLFRAAFYVYMGLWTVAMDNKYPDSPNKHHRHKKWLEYGFKFVERYLKDS